MSTGNEQKKPGLLEILDAVRVLEKAGLFQWGPVPTPPPAARRVKPVKRQRKKKWRRVTKLEIATVKKLVKNGLSIAEASRRVGHAGSTMHRHLKKG